MSFLNPFMLLGLAAAAVPIAVHFFNLRRPRRVDFSSLAFVQQVEQRTMQRLRLKRWLLLALRVLAVACLAMAFAQPVLGPNLAGSVGAGSSSPASMAVVVDNSLSMTRRDGQGPYLRQAKARAAALVGQMRPSDEMNLGVTAGPGGSSRRPYRNTDAAREAVEGVEARPGAQPLARAARRAARRLQESSVQGRELYLLTDLQASTLADTLANDRPAAPETEGLRVALVPVGNAPPANIAVTDVSVESRIVEVGQPTRLTATLRNFGTEAIDDYGASLYLGEERLAQTTASLGAGASQTVSFTVTPRQRGWLAGTVQTEGDDFPADDTRHFVLHVPRLRRVLVVRGQGQPARYVELALASEGGAEQAGSDSSDGSSQVFQTRSIAEGQLAGADLSAYDTVVLVGPQTLASGTREALARYVEDGGGLLAFPGANMERASYNALLKRLDGGQITGMSGALASGNDENDRQPVASFERVDTSHPLFEGVFDQAHSGENSTPAGELAVERPRLYRVANYTPRSGSEQTLIQLSNGRPFLQEVRHGQGAALFMASAPNEAWSDLPTRGLFVPLLYRSLFYLSSSGSTAGDALTAGRAGELRVRAAADDNAPLRLVGPEGEEFTPEQRRLFGATLLRTSSQMRTPGVYDVRRGDELVRRVALNLDPEESDVRAAEAEEAAGRLAQALGLADEDVRVLSNPGEEDLTRTLRAERAGLELWNVFLLLALLFLVAEMVAAHQMRPERS